MKGTLTLQRMVSVVLPARYTVLGLARTGLIFTRIQEGAQPGGLIQPQPGQTELGIPYHVPSCWVLVGGGRRGGNSLAAWEGTAVVRSERAVLFCGFVLCIPLFCIVVVAVSFVCCSVKLPLSQPTSFCLFLSILLCTPEEGGVAAWRFCCRLQLKREHHPSDFFKCILGPLAAFSSSG